jgi:hypothetical protein
VIRWLAHFFGVPFVVFARTLGPVSTSTTGSGSFVRVGVAFAGSLPDFSIFSMKIPGAALFSFVRRCFRGGDEMNKVALIGGGVALALVAAGFGGKVAVESRVLSAVDAFVAEGGGKRELSFRSLSALPFGSGVTIEGLRLRDSLDGSTTELFAETVSAGLFAGGSGLSGRWTPKGSSTAQSLSVASWSGSSALSGFLALWSGHLVPSGTVWREAKWSLPSGDRVELSRVTTLDSASPDGTDFRLDDLSLTLFGDARRGGGRESVSLKATRVEFDGLRLTSKRSPEAEANDLRGLTRVELRGLSVDGKEIGRDATIVVDGIVRSDGRVTGAKSRSSGVSIALADLPPGQVSDALRRLGADRIALSSEGEYFWDPSEGSLRLGPMSFRAERFGSVAATLSFSGWAPPSREDPKEIEAALLSLRPTELRLDVRGEALLGGFVDGISGMDRRVLANQVSAMAGGFVADSSERGAVSSAAGSFVTDPSKGLSIVVRPRREDSIGRWMSSPPDPRSFSFSAPPSR